MKIAISAMGNSLDAEVNQRFGRTRWLIIFETENGEYEAIDNSDNYNAPQGAGIKTADTVAKKVARQLSPVILAQKPLPF